MTPSEAAVVATVQDLHVYLTETLAVRFSRDEDGLATATVIHLTDDGVAVETERLEFSPVAALAVWLWFDSVTDVSAVYDPVALGC